MGLHVLNVLGTSITDDKAQRGVQVILKGRLMAVVICGERKGFRNANDC